MNPGMLSPSPNVDPYASGQGLTAPPIPNDSGLPPGGQPAMPDPMPPLPNPAQNSAPGMNPNMPPPNMNQSSVPEAPPIDPNLPPPPPHKHGLFHRNK
jgi:hypothetical protein